MFRFYLLAALFLQACYSANLAFPSYFLVIFTPTAIALDSQGIVLVAGSAVTDPVALTGGTGPTINFSPGTPMPLIVWVAR